MIPALMLAVGQESLVSFTFPAAPALRLLPQLANRMGVALEADKTASGQILMIDVDKVPKDRLLSEIAQATGSKWTPIKGGFRLTYNAASVRELWKREADYRAKEFSKTLNDLGARLKKDGTIEELFARGLGGEVVVTEDAVAGSHMGVPLRGAVRAAVRLGAGAIADVRPGQRVVYSTSPNANQRPLQGADFDQIGLALCAEERSFRTNYDLQFGTAMAAAATATLSFSCPDGTSGSISFTQGMSDEVALPGVKPGPLSSLPKELLDRINGATSATAD